MASYGKPRSLSSRIASWVVAAIVVAFIYSGGIAYVLVFLLTGGGYTDTTEPVLPRDRLGPSDGWSTGFTGR